MKYHQVHQLHNPFLCMLCGVPNSGKTSFRGASFDKDYVHLSTDDVIQKTATLFERTYDDCFLPLIKFAETILRGDLEKALKKQKQIVWDQTNLSVASRKKKLALVPNTYYKVIYVFPTPTDEKLADRAKFRFGKTIPLDVMDGMKANFVWPTYEEGWDEIRTVGEDYVARRMEV